MTNSDKFKSIIAAILQVDEDTVTDQLTPDRVDTWDSLNHINLIGALEQEFGITLATENLERTQSIPVLKSLLAQHGVVV
ncbi:MAG TPA: acyl carrier protein [Phycisphaerae bacterium]|nr:acyl carrier protein [Phycisphaerae bacterium]